MLNRHSYWGYWLPALTLVSAIVLELILRDIKFDFWPHVFLFILSLIPGVNWVFGLCVFFITLEDVPQIARLAVLGISAFWVVVGIAIEYVCRRSEKAVADAKLAQEISAAEADLARRRQVEDQQERSRQESLRARLTELANSSILHLEDIPDGLTAAEQFLDRAASDFEERAFSPFWRSVEGAMWSIGETNLAMESIRQNVEEYAQVASQYLGAVPRFPIDTSSVERMNAINLTVERMNRIVRGAERDRDFAFIYEQRKTSRILVSGFQTLERAIEGMGSRISDSLYDLRHSISDLSSTVTESIADISSGMQASAREINQAIDAHSERSARTSARTVADLRGSGEKAVQELMTRHDKALEMLDNLQRGQRPVGERFSEIFRTRDAK